MPVVHVPHFFPSAEDDSAPRTQGPATEAAKPYFLFVGRLEKLKGLQTLIPAFKSYAKAQLLVAGTGTYESNLRQLAGGSPNIRFLGHLPESKLPALYRQAVAVIVPSICFETFGQVIIESFSQKTPAVARNLGAMPEIIEESGGGLVYDTEAELIAAMDRLLTDSSYRRALGLSGYEAYLRNWTPEVHMQRYLALIHEIRQRQLAATSTRGRTHSSGRI